jgi:diguanylate cyclase (GGDEF)-like protein
VSTDQLTQIANRRGLIVSFEMERARAERTGRPLSIGLIDIDNFKRLNDELGHSAGDEALKSLAGLIRNNLRPTDHVARYGGEEFVVLLPETAVEEGEKVLTRLQRTLTGGLFMHKEQQVFVTFSRESRCIGSRSASRTASNAPTRRSMRPSMQARTGRASANAAPAERPVPRLPGPITGPLLAPVQPTETFTDCLAGQ